MIISVLSSRLNTYLMDIHSSLKQEMAFSQDFRLQNVIRVPISAPHNAAKMVYVFGLIGPTLHAFALLSPSWCLFRKAAFRSESAQEWGCGQVLAANV